MNPSGGPHLAGTDRHSLAIALVPVLREACAGRLSDVRWFRSPWQHGGAETGLAEWTGDGGAQEGVLVKLPIGPVELRWTRLLGRDGAVTPRVLAGGDTLGGYDLAWIVMERLHGSPLSTAFTESAVHELLAAAAEFQAAAGRAAKVEGTPPVTDWAHEIERARENARRSSMPEGQRWNEALKKVQKALPTLVSRWTSRPINSWCHGDFHPGNAMRRPPGPDGKLGACVLFDLALVHPGHWVEDAVYLERQFWGRRDLLHGVKPVHELTRLRRERGLSADDHHGEVAMLRRVLMAACVPAHVDREGHPRYTHAALELLEQTLPQAIH